MAINDPGWKFLRQSPEELLKDQSKKYDSKKNVWIPDGNEGFIAAEIETTDDNVTTVRTAKGEQKTLKTDDVQQMNPSKYEKIEDMADMTFLNEACVLHNLRQRYKSMMIYTYSGLFCVVINPYKRLPIYSENIVKLYMGKRRNEMPPHLFAVADESYRNMITDGENQSMLITGESGAGKTENTKKVIAYFAVVGASQQNKTGEKKSGSLEEQIVQTNPALEAFGNAKTVRNNNSSRFGKFIRIHFNAKGKLAGADIEHYLLEKSRVIRQAPGERCYHIFYQIMSNKSLREKLRLGDDVRRYRFVSQAEVTIDGVDDKEEMGLTDEAFDIMGFQEREKHELYRMCAAIMHMGELKFKQRPREEQAELDPECATELSHFGETVGCDPEALTNAFLKPRVRVGTEWVSKGQNLEQVMWAVGAMAKACYARMFKWLVDRCNKTLEARQIERQYFIGVLDIAGFEIFDLNSFEQLWINFVNEKLQQFFNHHMFVLEQEEYQREGIQWEFIDFGLDLQSCIDLIEKPMGVVSMLDEECIVPKASDITYSQKLIDLHLSKHPNMQKPKPPKGKQSDAQFAIVHYAGIVRYNTSGWLEKNKDPLNESVVDVLKSSADNQLIKDIWEDYKTAEDMLKEGADSSKKKGKGASFLTVSMMYRQSLNNLMVMLYSTHPHFIRCIIPNELKQSGVIDADLVLNQLTCNGVLEGIRICRKGFPNRMLFADFKQRYAILAPDQANSNKAEPKACCSAMLSRWEKENILQNDEYRVGHTKVFFKAGILARLEDVRDKALGKIITKFQCAIRAYLALSEYKNRLRQIESYAIVQSNVRAWCTLRTWPWFSLYGRVKPLIVLNKRNEAAEKLEQQLKETQQQFDAEKQLRQEAETQVKSLSESKQKLELELRSTKELAQKTQKELENVSEKLEDQRQENQQLQRKTRSLEELNATLRERVTALEKELNQLRTEKQSLATESECLRQELLQQDGVIAKLHDDRKLQERQKMQLCDDLNAERNRLTDSEHSRAKLEQELAAAKQNLELEKHVKQELERARKKQDQQHKLLSENFDRHRDQLHDLTRNIRDKEQEISSYKSKLGDQESLIMKLQAMIRDLQNRLEQVEDELETERSSKHRTERIRLELQEQLDFVTQRQSEVEGTLVAQVEQNKRYRQQLATMQHEMQKSSFLREKDMSELCSIHCSTVNSLRDLHQRANDLEIEISQILGQF